MGKQKYCVHPGEVRSKNDGDLHYIDATNLVRLYQLKRGTYRIFHNPTDHAMREPLICLYPRYDGRYSVELAEKEAYE